MAEAHIKVTSSGVDQLAGKLGKVDRKLGKVGRTGRRVGSGLTRNLGKVGHGVTKLTGLLAGLGAAAKGKEILDFDGRLGLLQSKMKASTSSMRALKDQVQGLSTEFGANTDEIVSGIETYQDFGGLVKQGLPVLREQVKLHKASGAAMSDLAKIDAVFIKQGMQVEDRIKAFAQLTAQADSGTVALEGLARVFPEIAAGAKPLGFEGMRGVKQLGAALQMAGEATGGKVEESKTLVKALLRDLTANAKKFGRKLKVKIFDKQGMMRDLDTIMAEIAKKTGGMMSGKKGLANFFTADSSLLAGAWAATLQKKGGGTVGAVNRATRDASKSDIDEALKRRLAGIAKESENAKKSLARLNVAADKYFGTLVRFVADNPLTAIGTAAGGYAALKTLPALGKWLVNRRRGGGGGGGLGGIASSVGVQRVFVTNMSTGGFGGGAGPGGKGGKAVGVAGKVGGAVASFGVGWAIGTALDEQLGLSDKISSATTQSGVLEGDYSRAQRVATGASLMKGGLTQAMRDAQARAKMLAGMSTRGLTAGGQQIDQAFIVKQMAQVLSSEKGIDVKAMIPLLQKIADKELKVEVKPAGGLERPEVQAGRGQQF